MAYSPNEILPPEVQIALAHTRPDMRDALRIFFELDARLARIIAATTEPILGQMRLAWWRDMMRQPAAERPSGDAVLDGIGQHWAGKEVALIALVDGWEHMLAPAPMGEDDAVGFAKGRAIGIMAAHEARAANDAGGDALNAAAWAWAFADMAAKVSLDEERELMIQLGLSKEAQRTRLPRSARGMAVLGALGARALDGGGRPLMEGRGASLLATRAAFFGK